MKTYGAPNQKEAHVEKGGRIMLNGHVYIVECRCIAGPPYLGTAEETSDIPRMIAGLYVRLTHQESMFGQPLDCNQAEQLTLSKYFSRQG